VAYETGSSAYWPPYGPGVSNGSPWGAEPSVVPDVYTTPRVYTPPKNGKQSLPDPGQNPFGTPAKTKATQTMLKKFGFNIAIDGLYGPQTKSAYDAYMHQVNPAKWNQQMRGTQVPTKPTPTTPTTPPGKTPKVPGTARTTQSATNPGQSFIDQLMSKFGIGASIVDPKSAANALVEAQYGPQAAALTRQMADARSQQQADQAQLGQWYKELVGQATQAFADEGKAFAGISSGADAATKGLVDSLGGSANPAASSAAAYGQINKGELDSNTQADLHALEGMGLGYAKQGIGKRADSARAFEQTMGDLFNQQKSLAAQRAAAYATAFNDYTDKNNTNRKDAFNQALSAALASRQLDQADLNLKVTKSNLLTASQNRWINNWRVNQGIKAQNLAGTTQPFESLSIKDKTSLANGLLQGVLGPKGNFNQNPVDIYNRMAGMLKATTPKYDPDVNPAAKSFIIGIINAHLSAWNRQNPQNPYHVAGGRVVSGI
jgi:hypothetical protein